MLGAETAQTLTHIITARDGISTFLHQRQAQPENRKELSFYRLPLALPGNWNPHAGPFTDDERDTRRQIYLRLKGGNELETPVQALGRFELAAQAEAEASNLKQDMPADKNRQKPAPNSLPDSALNAAVATAMANASAPPKKNTFCHPMNLLGN